MKCTIHRGEGELKGAFSPNENIYSIARFVLYNLKTLSLYSNAVANQHLEA